MSRAGWNSAQAAAGTGERRRPFRRSHLIAGVLGLVLLAIAVETYLAARAAVEAEFNLHAAILTCYLLEDFVTDTRRWPESWQELFEHGQAGTPPAMWTLPADEHELIRRVVLRFDVSLEDGARQRTQPEFLTTNGPGYPGALESKLQLVVSAARSVIASETQVPVEEYRDEE